MMFVSFLLDFVSLISKKVGARLSTIFKPDTTSLQVCVAHDSLFSVFALRVRLSVTHDVDWPKMQGELPYHNAPQPHTSLLFDSRDQHHSLSVSFAYNGALI